jgi:hypothetical protein
MPKNLGATVATLWNFVCSLPTTHVDWFHHWHSMTPSKIYQVLLTNTWCWFSNVQTFEMLEIIEKNSFSIIFQATVDFFKDFLHDRVDVHFLIIAISISIYRPTSSFCCTITSNIHLQYMLDVGSNTANSLNLEFSAIKSIYLSVGNLSKLNFNRWL